jgi:mono/diheme cytochrome c family protein
MKPSTTIALLCTALVLASAPVAAGPDGRDLHAYWDGRCKDCHGDSAAFARSTLRLDQGRLVGRHHGADLPTFLRNHYLADELVTPVTAMLAAQVAASPQFKEHCAGCHGTAADFARRSLVLRGSVLTGKASGKPVADYLATHGGLPPAETPAMLQTLRRVLQEVGGS